MKRLLALLGVSSLVTSASISVLACDLVKSEATSQNDIEFKKLLNEYKIKIMKLFINNFSLLNTETFFNNFNEGIIKNTNKTEKDRLRIELELFITDRDFSSKNLELLNNGNRFYFTR